MHKLAEICVKRPVFATVIVLSLVVVGWFAYQQLGVDRFPKVDIPTITITTRLVGAAPEEIETDISDKIEEAVNTISGVDELQSISSEGTSQVIVSFVLEKDIEVAAQEVRDKVNAVADSEKLAAVGVTTSQLVAALQSQNVQIPGGKVEQGLRDLTLRTYGRVTDPQDFANISITTRNGYPIKVGDVARIEDSV